jgi:hypothetical protein
MKKSAVSRYLSETIASGHKNQLPIASVCNAKCFFAAIK